MPTEWAKCNNANTKTVLASTLPRCLALIEEHMPTCKSMTYRSVDYSRWIYAWGTRWQFISRSLICSLCPCIEWQETTAMERSVHDEACRRTLVPSPGLSPTKTFSSRWETFYCSVFSGELDPTVCSGTFWIFWFTTIVWLCYSSEHAPSIGVNSPAN
jgi:hypothetical protein